MHHLSYPKGSSVNDVIPDYCSTVKYASVGDAIKLLKWLGPSCFMAKTDVKSAFPIIPIHPADLLGMKWDNILCTIMIAVSLWGFHVLVVVH